MNPAKIMTLGRAPGLLGAAALALVVACGGGSDSGQPTGGGGSGGSAGGGTSTGGTTAMGGMTGAGGMTSGMGGASGAGGMTARMGGASGAVGGSGPAGMGGMGGQPATGACPPQSRFTLAVHIVMTATWPATAATGAGTDKIHLWNLSKLAVNGTQLSGNETRSCGTTLPPFMLNGAGRLVTGGSKVHVEIPHSVWEAPAIPRLNSMGTLSGWDPGSKLDIVGTVALMGLTMPDPSAPWPDSYSKIMAVDVDGDGKPGFTAVPRTGMDHVQPPTGLGIFGSAPTADQVYLASRTVVGLHGMLTSCTEGAGTADISAFDSHVVGCHVKGGNDCTPAQTDFVDQSRTIYKITGATFTAKQVPENASCEDVRRALP